MRKRGLLTDDKERGRKREREKKGKKEKPEEEDQEAICEEIVAACQSSDCSRLMYGMLTNGFRYVITRVVARNEIYAVVSRNYILRVVGPIFYFARIIRAPHRTMAGRLRPTDYSDMKFRSKKLIFSRLTPTNSKKNKIILLL